jgi:hypothetical protein
MQFTRRAGECSLSDLKRNENIKIILQTAQVMEFDVDRNISERIRRNILNYKPKDERNIVRPL